jgi:hypothetical protein
MDTSGIYISSTRLKSLSLEQRTFVLGLITGDPQAPSLALHDSPALVAPGSADIQVNKDDHFAELSPGQARDFYAGCGEKTKRAVDAIAASPSRMIQVADIAKAVGVEASELRGVWGGLTRRTATVTGDPKAYLFDWHEGTQKYDQEGNYVDQTGEVTELTYSSLRKALKL